MKKVLEFLVDHADKVIGAAIAGWLAYLASVGYWFCRALSINGYYCDPFPVHYELFVVGGVLLGMVLKLSRLWFSLFVLVAIILVIVSPFGPLPKAPQEWIEFGLVAPFQFLIGVIVGQALVWIWITFGSILTAGLRKVLGL
jgi:hypothetical protein